MMKEYFIKDIMQKFGVKRLVVQGWINRKLFPNAERREEPVLHWVIPAKDLENFVPPPVRVGRPRDQKPSAAAETKRRQREDKNSDS